MEDVFSAVARNSDKVATGDAFRFHSEALTKGAPQ